MFKKKDETTIETFQVF